MKTTLIIAFFALSTITNAQCLREGFFQPIDDPDQYPVSGVTTLNFETDGTKQVIFQEDFATVQGLELRVYLSTTPRLNQGGSELEITTEPLQDDNGGMDTGDPITGMKVYELPEDVLLFDYDYVIIQCVMADVLWGRADLGPTVGADCDTLSTAEILAAQLSISPNPASDNFILIGLKTSAQIAIFDMLGKEVKNQAIAPGSSIDISSLKTGVYLVSIESNELQTTQKLIIQ